MDIIVFNMNIITWGPVIERHLKGTLSEDKSKVIWIRLDKEEKVTGIYFLFNTKEKEVPENLHQETLEGAKEFAERTAQLFLINNVKHEVTC